METMQNSSSLRQALAVRSWVWHNLWIEAFLPHWIYVWPTFKR